MLLLDTSVAIALRDRDVVVARLLADRPTNLALSLVTLAELEGGIAANPAYAADRRAALARLLPRVTILPFDRAVVAAYSVILEATGFSRRRILDRLIAATAIVHDMPVATVNGADFRGIPDLKLEVWPTAAQ